MRRQQEKQEERQQRQAEAEKLQEHLDTIGQKIDTRIDRVEERVGALEQSLEEQRLGLQQEIQKESDGLQKENDKLRAEFLAELQQLTGQNALDQGSLLSPHATSFVPKSHQTTDNYLAATSVSQPTSSKPQPFLQPSIVMSSPRPVSQVSTRPADLRPVQRPSSYDGKAPWDSYQIQFETAAEINNWGPEEKVKYLVTSLTGSALAVLHTIPPEKRQSYPELVAALGARFNDGKTGEYAKIALQERMRKAKESLPELAADVESLVRKAYPSIDERAIDTLACDHFIRALTDQEVKQQVKYRAPTTLKQALEFAVQIEAACWTVPKSATTRHHVRAISAEGGSQEPKYVDLLEQIKRLVESLTSQLGTSKTQRDRSRTRCYNCGEPGHIARNCRRPRTDGNGKSSKIEPSTDQSGN